MTDLLVVALAGFLAAMVDGALGMGFGPTSSTLLLSTGLSPAMTATTVNLAKVATGVASGASHWRLANIDRRLVLSLALPGALGAVIGTTLLTVVDTDDLRPVLALVLLLVGLRVLIRYGRGGAGHQVPEAAPAAVADTARSPLTKLVATAGGTTNGMVGAWGPVVTPYLLQRGLPPRLVVGSVTVAEIAVALVSSVSLITTLGRGGLDGAVVVAMMLGGCAAAPLAASVARSAPPRLLGMLMAALLLGTQTQTLAAWVTPGPGRWLATASVELVVLAVGLRPWLAGFRAPQSPVPTSDATPAPAPVGETYVGSPDGADQLVNR